MKYKIKKRLTEQQEFEIMKLVLDKFLWVGFAVIAFGAYKMAMESMLNGLLWFGAGVFLLVLFIILIVKEYEIIR